MKPKEKAHQSLMSGLGLKAWGDFLSRRKLRSNLGDRKPCKGVVPCVFFPIKSILDDTVLGCLNSKPLCVAFHEFCVCFLGLVMNCLAAIKDCHAT